MLAAVADEAVRRGAAELSPIELMLLATVYGKDRDAAPPLLLALADEVPAP